jgi:predicted RNA-binding Zn-ribbon protein involved in translation (DUF1610 family)
MQTLDSAELESDGSIASTSDFCSDACPHCGTECRRTAVSRDGESTYRLKCPVHGVVTASEQPSAFGGGI